jgi:hypothetical protein
MRTQIPSAVRRIICAAILLTRPAYAQTVITTFAGALYWCAAALGVFLTPVGLGVPLFAVNFLLLLWRTIKVFSYRRIFSVDTQRSSP